MRKQLPINYRGDGVYNVPKELKRLLSRVLLVSAVRIRLRLHIEKEDDKS